MKDLENYSINFLATDELSSEREQAIKRNIQRSYYSKTGELLSPENLHKFYSVQIKTNSLKEINNYLSTPRIYIISNNDVHGALQNIAVIGTGEKEDPIQLAGGMGNFLLFKEQVESYIRQTYLHRPGKYYFKYLSSDCRTTEIDCIYVNSES